jgi:hypothetical protein
VTSEKIIFTVFDQLHPPQQLPRPPLRSNFDFSAAVLHFKGLFALSAWRQKRSAFCFCGPRNVKSRSGDTAGAFLFDRCLVEKVWSKVAKGLSSSTCDGFTYVRSCGIPQ